MPRGVFRAVRWTATVGGYVMPGCSDSPLSGRPAADGVPEFLDAPEALLRLSRNKRRLRRTSQYFPERRPEPA